MPTLNLNNLNKKQQEAVKILEGPLLILAGAGSGKTLTLTYRIANLIANGISPQKILAVTFTNKAAGEMKSRISKLLQNSKSFGSPHIGTFHGLCVRILREDIESLNNKINRNFVIFDANESLSVIKKIMKEQGMPKELHPKAVSSHISSAKNSLISPQKYPETVGVNQFTGIVSRVYNLYQEKLANYNAVDFDDLLLLTVKIFESSPKILAKFQNRWEHMLVDEYQDTNFAQYRLIHLLVKKHQNLCVIGDDYQSIYSFRGADFTNILNFEKDFPSAQVILLEQNYRSTANILNNANKIIANNETGRKKNLWTDNNPGKNLQLYEYWNERDEARQIVQIIQDEMAGGNSLNQKQTQREFSDFAILYRMNALSRVIEEELIANNIPYQIVGGLRFLDRKEIKDLIAYLRLIFNPNDDEAFLRIINTPTRSIGKASLGILESFANDKNLSLFNATAEIDELDSLPYKKQEVFQNFREKILLIYLEPNRNKYTIKIFFNVSLKNYSFSKATL